YRSLSPLTCSFLRYCLWLSFGSCVPNSRRNCIPSGFWPCRLPLRICFTGCQFGWGPTTYLSMVRGHSWALGCCFWQASFHPPFWLCFFVGAATAANTRRNLDVTPGGEPFRRC